MLTNHFYQNIVENCHAILMKTISLQLKAMQ